MNRRRHNLKEMWTTAASEARRRFSTGGKLSDKARFPCARKRCRRGALPAQFKSGRGAKTLEKQFSREQSQNRETESATMNDNENRKRTQELRWIGFQKLLTGIVIIFGVGCIYFIFSDEDADLHSHSYSGGSYSRGKGLGIVFFAGAWGLWNIVRGIIYLIRAQSGDEHYAKCVEDVMDKYERKQDELMGQKMGKSGSMHNVLVLWFWVFLFLAVVGAFGVGYLFWTRP